MVRYTIFVQNYKCRKVMGFIHEAFSTVLHNLSSYFNYLKAGVFTPVKFYLDFKITIRYYSPAGKQTQSITGPFNKEKQTLSRTHPVFFKGWVL